MSADEARWRELGRRMQELLEALHSHDHSEQLLLEDLILGGDGRVSSPSGTYRRARPGGGE
jgi:hypothetical protein